MSETPSAEKDAQAAAALSHSCYDRWGVPDGECVSVAEVLELLAQVRSEYVTSPAAGRGARP